MINESFVELAIVQALKSTYPHKIGCVIFKGNKIISTGHNQIRHCAKIPSKYKIYRDSLHAEQHAILNAPSRKSLKGASILVIRINPNKKNLLLAKPCMMCYDFIEYIGIKKMYYSTQENTIKMEKISEYGI